MDVLLKLGSQPAFRSFAARVGLPISLPPTLRRARGALRQRELNDEPLALCSVPGARMTTVLGACLAPLGARVEWHGSPDEMSVFHRAAEAWGEPVSAAPIGDEGARLFALLFDATGCAQRETLDAAYAFFHRALPRLKAGGRILIFADVPSPSDEAPAVAAFSQALEGFARSLAKEVGRKGITCNLLRVAPGASVRSVAVVRYLLSNRASFVTAQPLCVTGGVAVPLVPVFTPGPLVGKVALVTGAARGIGAETARALGREGAKVLVLDHPASANAGSALAEELNGEFVAIDLGEPTALMALQTAIRARYPRLDIVVHNAGITRDKTLARMPEAAWNAVLTVNLEAIVRMTDEMLTAGWIADQGRLVLLSSVGGIAGNVGQTNYAAAKAGLIGYVRSLAPRLSGRGITVNAIAPGLIETQMTARMPALVREAARRLSALNQGGLPADVAEAIVFLCLPDACGVTGTVLRVCGGALVGA